MAGLVTLMHKTAVFVFNSMWEELEETLSDLSDVVHALDGFRRPDSDEKAVVPESCPVPSPNNELKLNPVVKSADWATLKVHHVATTSQPGKASQRLLSSSMLEVCSPSSEAEVTSSPQDNSSSNKHNTAPSIPTSLFSEPDVTTSLPLTSLSSPASVSSLTIDTPSSLQVSSPSYYPMTSSPVDCAKPVVFHCVDEPVIEEDVVRRSGIQSTLIQKEPMPRRQQCDFWSRPQPTSFRFKRPGHVERLSQTCVESLVKIEDHFLHEDDSVAVHGVVDASVNETELQGVITEEPSRPEPRTVVSPADVRIEREQNYSWMNSLSRLLNIAASHVTSHLTNSIFFMTEEGCSKSQRKLSSVSSTGDDVQPEIRVIPCPREPSSTGEDGDIDVQAGSLMSESFEILDSLSSLDGDCSDALSDASGIFPPVSGGSDNRFSPSKTETLACTDFATCGKPGSGCRLHTLSSSAEFVNFKFARLVPDLLWDSLGHVQSVEASEDIPSKFDPPKGEDVNCFADLAVEYDEEDGDNHSLSFEIISESSWEHLEEE